MTFCCAPWHSPGIATPQSRLHYTTWPHEVQKCAPEGESLPHWLQNRPELAGTYRTSCLTSCRTSGEVPLEARAQISATHQPMMVHPKKKFTRKIPAAPDPGRKTREMTVGRK